jgi:hypothetical protein
VEEVQDGGAKMNTVNGIIFSLLWPDVSRPSPQNSLIFKERTKFF